MNEHSITNEKVILQENDSVVIQFMIPAECDFFDGHFPEFKLMPAVGQFQTVTRFAKKYFNISNCTSQIKRMKFSAKILPDTEAKLELNYSREKNTVNFTLSDANEAEKVYSSGIYVVAE